MNAQAGAPSSTPSTGALIARNKRHNDPSPGAIAGIAVGSIAGALVIALLAFFLYRHMARRRAERRHIGDQPMVEEASQPQYRDPRNWALGPPHVPDVESYSPVVPRPVRNEDTGVESTVELAR